ncbi:MAG: ATP-binding protein/SpoIIE family protein phosphatase [Steroidobacteraceae bacterium]
MQIHVAEKSGVGEARRIASELSRVAGFDGDDVSRAALIAAELATNLIKHAGGGDLFIGEFADCDGSGIELMSIDKGRGMEDVGRCLRDGFSTAGSPGTGLGAIARAADHFDYYSTVKLGTVFFARLVKQAAVAPRTALQIGSVVANYPGELDCGDAWSVSAQHETLLVADGLGHGTIAAAASGMAREIFNKHAGEDCVALMGRMHRALAPTRGAAVALAYIDRAHGMLRFVGVGNIAGSVVDETKLRKMVSHNGTAGHKAPNIAEFTYPFTGLPLVIMHSDGLSTRWEWDHYPGLSGRHASVIAGVLFRDHNRHNDDATVLVVRAR